jgi:hypothetical protein
LPPAGLSAVSATQDAAPIPNVAPDFHVRSKQALLSAQKHRHSGYGPECLRTCETPSTDFLWHSYSQKKEKKENKLGTVK